MIINEWKGMVHKPETPKVGLGIEFFKENGDILLILRKGSHGAGEWSLPGGHMELGESLLETARREVMEEIGIPIIGIRRRDFTNDIFEEEGLHYITLFVKALWDQEKYEKEIKNLEPDKCEEIKWFERNNLPKNLFGPLENLIFKPGIYR